MQLTATACIAFALLAGPGSRTALAQCPPQEVAGLTGPGNGPLEQLGQSVAISGDTALVGCPGYGQWGPSSGAVLVYRHDPFDSHAWSHVATLVAPPSATTYGWTVALDGDTAAVACVETTGWQSLVVHVLERDAGGPNAWGRVATLVNDLYPAGNADHFGRGLEVDGDRIAVGAPLYNPNGTNSGSVYLFERHAGGPNAWGRVKRIDRPGVPSISPSEFGRDLDLDGDEVLVGDERTGRAHLFRRDVGGQGQWGAAKLFSVQPQFPYTDAYALSVALDSGVALVGWMLASQTQATFAVRVHERDLGGPGVWGLAQTLTPAGASSFSRFGRDIALGPQRALIGADLDLGTPSLGGAAYLFERSGSTPWSQTARLVVSDTLASDGVGTSVDFDGTLAILGNLRNSNALNHLGKVHVFDLASPAPPVTYCTPGTSSSGCVGLLAGVGSPSASAAGGFELVAHGIDPRRATIGYYALGSAAIGPLPGSSSWRCLESARQRLGTANSTGTSGACDGEARFDWNAFRSSHPAALGVPFSAGAVVYAQAWWRDPASKSGGASTDGLSFTLCP